MKRQLNSRPHFLSMVLALLAATFYIPSLRASADEAQGMHPYPLWPSEPVPGWPGVGADEDHTAEKIEELLGGSPADPRPAIYGQPEFLAYPGAVHHVRREYQRYNPPYPLFNHETLTTNYILHKMPGYQEACVEFAEPVYYNAMYRPRIPTSQRRPPVKAYPWKPGSPAIKLDLGKLKRGTYAIRPICAAPTVKVVEPKKFVFLKLRINDWPDAPDKWNGYILRAQTLDNFYAIQQFWFHARDDRVFRAELSLLPESEADLLLYNVDLHDRHGQLARRRGKKRTVLVDTAARHAAWAKEREKGGERLKKRLEQQKRTPEEQKRFDDFVWRCGMPPLNCHWPGWIFWIKGTGRDLDQFRLCRVPEEWEELVSDYDFSYARDNRTLLLNGEPVPPGVSLRRAPGPLFLRCKSGKVYKDGRNSLHTEPPTYELRGLNVYEQVKGEDGKTRPGKLLGPLSEFKVHFAAPGNSGYRFFDSLMRGGKSLGSWRQFYYLDGKLYKDGKLVNDEPRRTGSPFSRFYDEGLRAPLISEWEVKPGLYYDAAKVWIGLVNERDAAYWLKYGDRQTARDLALKLVRQAHSLIVAQLSDPLHGMGPLLAPNGLDRRIVKYFGYTSTATISLYDKLFEFIDGNEEFAQAVGRYLPGVDTPGDVIAFLDTHLVQYFANLILKQRHFTDHGTPALLMQAVLVQDDPSITDPWMEFLFTRSWEYPQALSGLGDNLITGGGRDGGTNIGSFFYGLGGQMQPVQMLEEYIRKGGNPKYDLTNPKEYPNSRLTPYFAFEGSAAGRQNPGIGDVGGPSEYYGRFVDHAGMRHIMATGWRWHRDPKFAWELANHFGRKGEPDTEWAEIVDAAKKCPRDPFLMNRSRVLSNWGGYLTSNPGTDDFRFIREAAIRVGTGWGHAHADSLDLRLFAFGCTMASDFNQRPAYGWPRHQMSRCHNLVEVDGANWASHAWVRSLFDAPGSPFLSAESVAPYGMEHVKLFCRQVALVDVAEGLRSSALRSSALQSGVNGGQKAGAKAGPAHDPNVTLPSSYVFDVFRVSGGEMHTYCFHGCVDDDFEANVGGRVPPEADEDSPDGGYLSPFRWNVKGDRGDRKGPDYWVGRCGGRDLEATWRLDRKSEDYMLGLNRAHGGATTTPRKYTRLVLFDQRDSKILHAVARAKGATGYYGRCLYAQRRSRPEALEGNVARRSAAGSSGKNSLDSVFVALIEPYAGEPSIVSQKRLKIRNNETDALKAVAVEAKTKNGRTDLCFADGRPGKVRTLVTKGGFLGLGRKTIEVSGEYAYLSLDGQGVRQAALTGGTLLIAPGLSIEVETPRYEAVIKEVDYLSRKAIVEGAIPPRLTGHTFEVGNDLHRTSYETSTIESNDGRTAITMRKGLEIMRTRVRQVNTDTGTVVGAIAMFRHRGRDAGLVASNDGLTRFWRVAYTGGNRHAGHTFKLSHLDPKAEGPIFTKEDFPGGAGLRVWEFGVGDRIGIQTGVSIRRTKTENGVATYEVFATSPCKLVLEGSEAQVSADGNTWQECEAEAQEGHVTISVAEAMLALGEKFFLNVE